MPTALITGCSSGFGLETARLFLSRSWEVIATMREPQSDLLPSSDRLRLMSMDICDLASIARVAESVSQVDALVNNAGIGAPIPVELTPLETARQLFETNVMGTLAVTQAFLPQMRARRSGVIVNVTSMVTMKALPLVGVYSASKAAVNAFTEFLSLEVEPLGVRVCLVLPGRSPGTSFGANALKLPSALRHVPNSAEERCLDATSP
ncbi:SDR family NAD(P)-dependent oxidoreductase [Stenotrophomonas sp. S39]|uniref:SDR family NAD(P)-dependent oxidoreductase n=1 Tax=Stenotrophomonas sp. S39 TaxID=2767451 RepID=UPI00190BF4E0|nr:SDR family NAD(P)-dependent oxidoreductase [Stenotrophomonas sp. S39]MBK0052753.1 SDR family NAD(P)-dependent oxidoreductase [Stenotrophomonas sp. S39]